MLKYTALLHHTIAVSVASALQKKNTAKEKEEKENQL